MIGASAKPGAACCTPSSPILVMHARFEQSYAYYNAADAAVTRASACGFADSALELLDEEQRALRLAILYQVPASDEELTLLCYHVYLANDEQCVLYKTALEAALAAILNYLVSEGRADMDKIGSIFRESAMLCFRRIGSRTGDAEALETAQGEAA